MNPVVRLSERARKGLPVSILQPAYDRDKAGIGIVHLGVGAFMRAHVGMYCDDAMNEEGGDWCIAGVSLRQRTVREQLQPQDCLYCVGVMDDEQTSYRLAGAIKSIDVAPDDPQKIVRMLAAPGIRVITITVTEKGYCLDPDSGALDLVHPDIAHDLENPACPKSTIGFIVAGLQQRFANAAPPLTIVACDNLPGNGSRLRAAVLRFAHAIDPGLESRIAAEIAFPATMVDRIVPATVGSDIEATSRALGCRDEAFVKTEPFSQWVIEDRFANGRPGWEAGGAMFVADVAPYETVKLRLLNGAHSALAYLGYLAGFEYVHEVMRNPDFVEYLRELMKTEISPVTPEPRGMRHVQYIDALLARFANTALLHRTWQIAMDGSQKLPQRLLNTARQQLRSGGKVAAIGLAVAAWMRYALGRDESGGTIDVRDPLASRFAAIAAEDLDEPEEIVSRFFGLAEVFGDDLSRDNRFAAVVAGSFRELLEKGAAATVRDFVGTGGH